MTYPYLYRWRRALRGAVAARYHGQRCQVLARGALNSALVEFESGERAVISRNALRKAQPTKHMLDLCAGLGGASQVMRARGWQVTTLDNDPAFGCDITADLTTWHYVGPVPDLLWISPPCTEFARESMPWCRTGSAPDMALVKAAKRLVHEIQPRYWIIENVRGAVPFFRPLFGPPRQIIGPFYLWGYFPLITVDMSRFKKKESYPSSRPDLRAMVPEALSLAVAVAIESQITLFDKVAV